MTADERIDAISERLTAAFSPTQLIIRDDSAQHVGHVGARSGGGHFAITITCDHLREKNRVAAHQAIYHALADLMGKEIHALQIHIQ
jgi:BolA protein